MDWTDQGIVLSARRHGENAAIVSLLTSAHGRHAGLVRGGSGRRLRGILQPGNEVEASWRARLAEHLGSYTIELHRARAADLLAHADRLAGLTAAAAIIDAVLPEREPHSPVFQGFLSLLDAFEGGEALIWGAVYVRFELGLLTELGFGLDLSHCASTGVSDNLVYVSPRSGRAVSAEAGAPYAERLLALPQFLLGSQAGGVDTGDLRDGLALTGFFLDQQVFAPNGQREPAARGRLVDRITRLATTSGAIKRHDRDS
jgi:DNA repair protein RecO (recombination protein O)